MTVRFRQRPCVRKVVQHSFDSLHRWARVCSPIGGYLYCHRPTTLARPDRSLRIPRSLTTSIERPDPLVAAARAVYLLMRSRTEPIVTASMPSTLKSAGCERRRPRRPTTSRRRESRPLKPGRALATVAAMPHGSLRSNNAGSILCSAPFRAARDATTTPRCA